MKHRLLILFTLLAAVALSACTPSVNLLDESKLNDTSLLTGDPCEAPCWNGITPGETRYRDAKLIIESDTRYKITEEPDPQEDNPGRLFTFGEGENPGCCQVFSRDGETVSSFLLQMAPVLSFGPVFDTLGEPQYVSGQDVNEEQGYLALVYPELPLVLYAFVAGQSGALSVTSEIIGAMYMANDEMDQLLTCTSLNNWGGFVSFASYAGGEDFDYVGEGVGDEVICPTGEN